MDPIGSATPHSESGNSEKLHFVNLMAQLLKMLFPHNVILHTKFRNIQWCFSRQRQQGVQTEKRKYQHILGDTVEWGPTNPCLLRVLANLEKGFLLYECFPSLRVLLTQQNQVVRLPVGMTGRICRTGVCGGLVTAHSRATGNLTLPPARIQLLQKPVGFLV